MRLVAEDFVFASGNDDDKRAELAAWLIFSVEPSDRALLPARAPEPAEKGSWDGRSA
jgi:hypothetical protein